MKTPAERQKDRQVVDYHRWLFKVNNKRDSDGTWAPSTTVDETGLPGGGEELLALDRRADASRRQLERLRARR